jgi:hypothetical protein
VTLNKPSGTPTPSQRPCDEWTNWERGSAYGQMQKPAKSGFHGAPICWMMGLMSASGLSWCSDLAPDENLWDFCNGRYLLNFGHRRNQFCAV